ncbi:liprin-beta-2-like isoform X3 [Cynoglossus semilaevis]|uniref:Liprin-beta-2-like n=2 Tax=Cynoglossus semilaevis TaxID=244447 RepID=A0A3P8X481_CYNSE|nr:liprin-beta-2-like isoform X3 [Cynoglossus semilaevis]
METEASHMLEAALDQMDDIIAGSKAAAVVDFSINLYDLGSSISTDPLQVVQLAEDLKLALDLHLNQEHRETLREQLQTETVETLRDWLWGDRVKVCSTENNDSYQERLLRLEGDKESLVLQVSVLTDQVEAQGEKIRDLESSLEEHRQKLASTEELLQQELVRRTRLETEKLDLMDEVSYLKLKLTEVSVEETDGSQPEVLQDDQLDKAEGLAAEVEQLKSRVEELEGQRSQFEKKLRTRKTQISELQQILASKDAEIEGLKMQLLTEDSSANDSAERDQEYQRLKAGMESLLTSNDEKDRRIEELTVLLGQYRKLRDVVALTQGSSEEELNSVRTSAVSHRAHADTLRSEFSSPKLSPLILSSSSYNRALDLWPRSRSRSNSLEELHSDSLQENLQLELSKYQTLPGKRSRKMERRVELNGHSDYMSPLQVSPVLHQGHDYSLRPTEEQEQEQEEFLLSDRSTLSSGQQSPGSLEQRKNHRGIRKLWGKIRRSESGSPVQVHDPELGEFRRGGFRATAGPPLARSWNIRDMKTPFSTWNTEQVCDWLEDIGLGPYSVLARQWVTSGQTLLSATPHDLEKEMAMKSPLHRKKLQLAMKAASSPQPERSVDLDHVWVTGWLDDIGLPQYKDQFYEGRVDGLMLQYLTVNDLLLLKVTSQLHHLSIKAAIRVLHLHAFNPHCLRRRAGKVSQFSPTEVVQWSNHRVMEWLRSVDLAEYAPNLRGSGVHGGLIMLEPRVNADSLATLPNIHTHTTRLRRHITTNFNNLVGSEAQQEKREFMEALGSSPLNISAKVKPKKLGLSNLTHLRRRRPDESTDYVCPVQSPGQPVSGHAAETQTRPRSGFRGLNPILDREQGNHSRDQKGPEDWTEDQAP